ncbi:MlaC/ttg2D family ABC transporter substrate-binding protein [Paracoccus spongiarum]|uniref:ABC transporter substrate-binding protein n=1 Tax=Paracoccus spongiarum TaxID=3064387 RepID=A0ABT9J7T9_9RHOB|nr:ABC transporter substrate-binding protein [Paracoccus sp. 2205BS29-5]MDP5305874.1 ABC transporter substrate-binding protein [Paracoccus sp. 2205BS29-5]
MAPRSPKPDPSRPDPRIGRRAVLALIAGGAGLVAMRPALALGGAQAQAFIQRAVDDVYAVINSGQAPAAMYRQFEAILARYGDVDVVARTVLGPAARQVSAAQFASYKAAFQGYIGRKYGKRFREFVGGRIEVGGARAVKSYVVVDSVAYLSGRAPMKVEWHVSDRSGRVSFFNLIIEGVNMLASERAEMAAMLARRKGDVAALTADLQRAG